MPGDMERPGGYGSRVDVGGIYNSAGHFTPHLKHFPQNLTYQLCHVGGFLSLHLVSGAELLHLKSYTFCQYLTVSIVE